MLKYFYIVVNIHNILSSALSLFNVQFSKIFTKPNYQSMRAFNKEKALEGAI